MVKKCIRRRSMSDTCIDTCTKQKEEKQISSSPFCKPRLALRECLPIGPPHPGCASVAVNATKMTVIISLIVGTRQREDMGCRTAGTIVGHLHRQSGWGGMAGGTHVDHTRHRLSDPPLSWWVTSLFVGVLGIAIVGHLYHRHSHWPCQTAPDRQTPRCRCGQRRCSSPSWEDWNCRRRTSLSSVRARRGTAALKLATSDGSLQIPNYTRTMYQTRRTESTSQPRTSLETCQAPDHDLNCLLHLDVGDGCLSILGNDITMVQTTARD
jgi:hypothetical protein